MAIILDNPDLISSDKVQSHTLIRATPSDAGDYVTAQETLYLAIVRPTTVRKLEKQEVPIYDELQDASEVTRVLSSVIDQQSSRTLIALDIETVGTDPLSPLAAIVGVGLTSNQGTFYVHTKTWLPGDARWEAMFSFLSNPNFDFIAHNLTFEMAWLTHFMRGFKINWKYDTLAAYRHLASEGYGQQNSSYGLKTAQLDLLGWEDKGNLELDEWLVANGYYTGNYKPESAREALYAYSEGKLKPNHGAMHAAPPDILGYYCGLDTYSTYHLLVSVFFPSCEPMSWAKRYWDYHTKLFINNVKALTEQRLDGIKLDVDALNAYYTKLCQAAIDSRNEFLTHKDIAPYIQEYRARKLAEYKEREPLKYKKIPPLGIEPAKLTKKGEISKTWKQWDQKRQDIENGVYNIVSQSWKDWYSKYEKMEDMQLFNLDSPPLRRWLFYDKLKFDVISTTEKGQPETGKNALKYWGEYGQMLKRYNLLSKEQSMVESCLAALQNGRIYPQFKAPGTFTGRWAGGSTEVAADVKKFNIQQIPKRKEYLMCWIPDEGKTFVDVDHVSIEPVVLTALSRDANMLKLYGPGAKKNDIYLFVGSMLPIIGEKIRAAGYDPNNPTEEGIESAKTYAKKERSISKHLALGAQYGMGVNKLLETLAAEGVKLTYDEGLKVWLAYWDIFKDVRSYGKKLEQEWYRNQGWVLNGIGRPVCCAEKQLKDITNRVIQSTAHDIHMMFVNEVLQLRRETKVPFKGIIWDFHDQTIVQTKVSLATKILDIYKEAYQRLNKKLKLLNPAFENINIVGDANIIPHLAAAKLPEEFLKG